MHRLIIAVLVAVLAISTVLAASAPSAVRVITLDAAQQVEIRWTQESAATIIVLTKTEPERAPVYLLTIRSAIKRTHVITDAYGSPGTVYTLYEYSDANAEFVQLGTYTLGTAATYQPPTPTPTDRRVYLPVVRH